MGNGGYDQLRTFCLSSVVQKHTYNFACGSADMGVKLGIRTAGV